MPEGFCQEWTQKVHKRILSHHTQILFFPPSGVELRDLCILCWYSITELDPSLSSEILPAVNIKWFREHFWVIYHYGSLQPSASPGVSCRRQSLELLPAPEGFLVVSGPPLRKSEKNFRMSQYDAKFSLLFIKYVFYFNLCMSVYVDVYADAPRDQRLPWSRSNREL